MIKMTQFGRIDEKSQKIITNPIWVDVFQIAMCRPNPNYGNGEFDKSQIFVIDLGKWVNVMETCEEIENDIKIKLLI